MLNLVALVVSSFEKYMTRLARQRTLQVLSQQSDATLRDIGVSRAMLNSGHVSWPLQSAELNSVQAEYNTVKPERSSAATTYHKVMSKARAIRELRACSDRELRDLGITRGSIVEAVQYGRPGIEQADSPQAAPASSKAMAPAIATAAPSQPQRLHCAMVDHQLSDELAPTHSATSDDRQAA